MWYRSLFLTRPTYGDKRKTAKDVQDSNRSRFWVFKISEECQRPETVPVCSAVPCFPHENIDDIRVMNIGNQPCEPFVTCLSAFCDWSRKLVDWPQDVRSSNTYQVQAFQDSCQRASGNSPTDPSFSILKWWLFKQRLGILLRCSVFFCQFAIPLKAFLEHVCPYCKWSFYHTGNFQILQQKYVIQTLFCAQQ